MYFLEGSIYSKIHNCNLYGDFNLKLPIQIAKVFTLTGNFILLNLAYPGLKSMLIALKLPRQAISIEVFLIFEIAYLGDFNHLKLPRQAISPNVIACVNTA